MIGWLRFFFYCGYIRRTGDIACFYAKRDKYSGAEYYAGEWARASAHAAFWCFPRLRERA